MFHNLKFAYLSKIILISFFVIFSLLFVNIWLYFNPSETELAIAKVLQFNNPAWLTIFMNAVSDSYIALAILAGGICIWCIINRKYSTAITLAISLASLLLIDPAKYLFQRPRPLLDDVAANYFSGTSFPSGHVYTATVLTCILCIVYIVGFKGAASRISIMLAGIYILLMAWSRIYLQAHYPSDVIGGAIFGVITVAIISLIYRWMRRNMTL